MDCTFSGIRTEKIKEVVSFGVIALYLCDNRGDGDSSILVVNKVIKVAK